MSQYDSNHDGRLTKEELASCASLRDSLVRYDGNHDDALTAEEIATRIDHWKGRGAFLPLEARVLLDGRPLVDATVSLTPEDFVGSQAAPASGTTDIDGRTKLETAAEKVPEKMRSRPVVMAGLYKVSVIHPKRTIPSRYNRTTTLGCEVFADTANPSSPLEFRLTSKP